MVEFFAVVWLTFYDGSAIQYQNEDGTKPIVQAETNQAAFNKCQDRVKEIITEMREDFKDHDPKPSTFMNGCTLKE